MSFGLCDRLPSHTNNTQVDCLYENTLVFSQYGDDFMVVLSLIVLLSPVVSNINVSDDKT